MRRIIALLMVASMPTVASAQATAQTTGRISTGIQQVENNSNSSKFGEYRDLRDDRVPLGFQFNTFNEKGYFLNAAGLDLTRRDQSLGLSVGNFGVWRVSARWDELPHNLSNKAMSPYTMASPGKLDVAQTMVIPFKKLATAGGDAAKVVESDAIAAAYAKAFSKPVDLENVTKTGAFELRYTGVQALDLSVGYSRRAKSGSKGSYGPIGDRPPRTLNIQLAEPIDYVTGDLKVAADFVRQKYQLRAEYLLSQFENDIDVLEWRNVWASAPTGSTFDTWDRAIGTYGRRPLAPDNKYQTATVSGGLALPFESRLTASIAYGVMEQDQALVPYAYQNDMLANKTLPRSTAEARMNTTHLSAEYFIAPVQRMNVRAWFRRFDLQNETTSSKWQYVTQDASSLTGTVAYVNKRTNEPIAWDRQNMGFETTVRLSALNSSIGLGFEREAIDREHRQAAHTTENTLRASWHARPASWLSLRTKYLHGARDGGEYDWRSPSESYWYEPAQANDNNDPRNSFEDHPDMRKFDMVDRQRDQVDFTVTLTPVSSVSLSSRVRFRRDDFAADVPSVQPLINLTVADREARTPGDQLGLLKSESRQVSVDATYSPSDRLGLNASYGFDVGTSTMRGLEFNENNKKNPSAVATAVLGPWTRASSQWTADPEDRTRYLGLGGTYDVVPNKVLLAASYTLSLSDYDIVYGGFGTVSFDGTALPANHEFGFTSPAPVKQRSHVADVSISLPLLRQISGRLGWQYESYSIRDWQQAAGSPQFESVGTDLFLRDTSRSNQWGNRLVSMGSYLAPSFTGHALYFGLNYQFGGGPPSM